MVSLDELNPCDNDYTTDLSSKYEVAKVELGKIQLSKKKDEIESYSDMNIQAYKVNSNKIDKLNTKTNETSEEYEESIKLADTVLSECKNEDAPRKVLREGINSLYQEIGIKRKDYKNDSLRTLSEQDLANEKSQLESIKSAKEKLNKLEGDLYDSSETKDASFKAATAAAEQLSHGEKGTMNNYSYLRSLNEECQQIEKGLGLAIITKDKSESTIAGIIDKLKIISPSYDSASIENTLIENTLSSLEIETTLNDLVKINKKTRIHQGPKRCSIRRASLLQNKRWRNRSSHN